MAEQKTPTSRVVRFATRGRRQSTLIGRDPSGRRIPGGPYTMWQGLTVVVAPFLLWHSRGVWLVWHTDGLSQIIAVAGLTVGAAWLAGRPQFSHSPFWSAAGLLSNCAQVIRGGPAGTASRTAGRTGTHYSGAAYLVSSTRLDPEACAGRQAEPAAVATPAIGPATIARATIARATIARATIAPATIAPATIDLTAVAQTAVAQTAVAETAVASPAVGPVTDQAPADLVVDAGSPSSTTATTAGRFCPTPVAGAEVAATTVVPSRSHRPMSGLEAFLAASADPILDLESSVSR